jgi:hypothetical protein
LKPRGNHDEEEVTSKLSAADEFSIIAIEHEHNDMYAHSVGVLAAIHSV